MYIAKPLVLEAISVISGGIAPVGQVQKFTECDQSRETFSAVVDVCFISFLREKFGYSVQVSAVPKSNLCQILYNYTSTEQKQVYDLNVKEESNSLDKNFWNVPVQKPEQELRRAKMAHARTLSF